MFQEGEFTLHSGGKSSFKIECDALTKADWKCLARMIAERVGCFSSVYGIPRGGQSLEFYLAPYVADKGPRLVVDDVWTTGASMREVLRKGDIGYVVFARGPLSDGVGALFTFTPDQVVR